MFKIQKKTVKIIALLTITIILNLLILPHISYAATYNQTVKSGISNFPQSYQNALKELQKMHPNWTFDAYYTGINWDTFINSQTCSTKKGISLISKSSENSWKCSCGYKDKTGSWVCASRGITAYYADPRNFLNEVNVFQFSEYTYNPKSHTLDGVKKSVKNTFLDASVTYTLNGKKQTKTYAEIIMDAAKESGMSPYSIRTKIIQEVGTGGSGSVTGNYSGYKGYYNFFNYGAYDDAAAGPIASGLQYAKNHGWNNQYTAIVEGAKLLSNSYTSAGQNTAYFYKWDVVGNKILTAGKSQKVDDSMLFTHNYMTNVQDPYSQSSSLWSIYNKAGILDEKINFVIPVYENMPNSTSKPSSIDTSGKTLYYADVETTLYVRSTPSTSGKAVASISKDTKVIMLQRKCKNADGLSWDKIQLADGTIGYSASMYLSPCDQGTTDIAPTAITLDKSNVSLEVGNGATITKTTLNATITPNNATNKNITWSTSNSKVANVSSGTVTAVGEGEATITVKTSNGKTATCKVTVTNVENISYKKAIVNADVLNVRKTASTSAASVAKIYENDWVKVIEESASKDSQYEWSKIQTSSGVTGYVAKEFLNMLEDIKIDEENKQILVTPDSIVKTINENNENLIITDASGKTVKPNDLIGTGFKVKDKSTGMEYVVIKKGDTNGDGEVDIIDLALLKRHLMKTQILKNSYCEAGILQSAGKEIDVVDLALLKRVLIGKTQIIL